MNDRPDDRLLVDLAREAVLLFAADAALLLIPILVVAVIVGLLQTIFSVQESSLSFLPKLAALVAALALAGGGIMNGLSDYLASGVLDMAAIVR